MTVGRGERERGPLIIQNRTGVKEPVNRSRSLVGFGGPMTTGPRSREACSKLRKKYVEGFETVRHGLKLPHITCCSPTKSPTDSPRYLVKPRPFAVNVSRVKRRPPPEVLQQQNDFLNYNTDGDDEPPQDQETYVPRPQLLAAVTEDTGTQEAAQDRIETNLVAEEWERKARHQGSDYTIEIRPGSGSGEALVDIVKNEASGDYNNLVNATANSLPDYKTLERDMLSNPDCDFSSVIDGEGESVQNDGPGDYRTLGYYPTRYYTEMGQQQQSQPYSTLTGEPPSALWVKKGGEDYGILELSSGGTHNQSYYVKIPTGEENFECSTFNVNAMMGFGLLVILTGIAMSFFKHGYHSGW